MCVQTICIHRQRGSQGFDIVGLMEDTHSIDLQISNWKLYSGSRAPINVESS